MNPTTDPTQSTPPAATPTPTIVPTPTSTMTPTATSPLGQPPIDSSRVADLAAAQAILNPTAAADDQTPEEKPSTMANIGHLVGVVAGGLLNWAIIPLAIVLILHNFVFQAFHVVGSSMTPTLHEADYLIISKVGSTGGKISKAFGKSSGYIPKRYEVVVFHYPKDPSLVFVKRAIGLPGDRVVVKDGQVTIYNAANPGGFDPNKGLTLAADTSLGAFDDTVPDGQIFVMGDNRLPNGSFDSREWGFLPSSYIIGDAVIRLLPVSTAKFL